MNSPYAEEHVRQYAGMHDLFGNRVPLPPKTDNQKRGELIDYFALKTGKPAGYIRMRLAGMMDLPTLYYLKSCCDQYAARPHDAGGGPWTKAFWGALKPKL